MSRVSLVLSFIILGSGCSVLFAPDRDAIGPDLDGAFIDAGADAMIDASETDGCVGPETLEVTCNDMTDNDCDGEIDCFDFDCRSADNCCTPTMAETACLDSTVPITGFLPQPAAAATDIMFSGGGCTGQVSEFTSAPGPTRGLVSRSCQPVNFGMTYTVNFRIATPCPSCIRADYAALSFGLTEVIVDPMDYADEFRFVILPDGSAFAEEAGTILGNPIPANTFNGMFPIQLVVDLDPGPSTDGIDVLFVSAVATQGREQYDLLVREPVMPLADLVCFMEGGGTATGLYAVVEGTGNFVQVDTALSRQARGCANPSQFRRPLMEPDLSIPAMCDVGGAGAPTLINYCYSNCDGSPPNVQWDLWADGSSMPRQNDTLDFLDFGTCGFVGSTLGSLPDGSAGEPWDTAQRPPLAAPYLWAIAQAEGAREPTLLAAYDDGAGVRVGDLWYAYARRETAMTDDFTIYGGRIRRTGSAVEDRARVLDLGMEALSECAALRDPLLLGDYGIRGTGHGVIGAFLLFTCDRSPGADSIGVAELELNIDTGRLELMEGTVNANWLTSSVGAFASRGVSAPEGFTEPSEDGVTLRLWFLARGVGSVAPTVGFAQGRGPLDGGLPVVTPYPANPILTNDSPAIRQDCVGEDCRITGLTVTPVVNDMVDYQFLIARERRAGTTVTYDFISLLQPKPMD